MINQYLYVKNKIPGINIKSINFECRFKNFKIKNQIIQILICTSLE